MANGLIFLKILLTSSYNIQFVISYSVAIPIQNNHKLVFHEFQDLRTPIYSGFCASSYVNALLRLFVILGTALRLFLDKDDVVDSCATAKRETGIGRCFICTVAKILLCCTYTFNQYSHYIHLSYTHVHTNSREAGHST